MGKKRQHVQNTPGGFPAQAPNTLRPSMELSGGIPRQPYPGLHGQNGQYNQSNQHGQQPQIYPQLTPVDPPLRSSQNDEPDNKTGEQSQIHLPKPYEEMQPTALQQPGHPPFQQHYDYNNSYLANGGAFQQPSQMGNSDFVPPPILSNCNQYPGQRQEDLYPGMAPNHHSNQVSGSMGWNVGPQY